MQAMSTVFVNGSTIPLRGYCEKRVLAPELLKILDTEPVVLPLLGPKGFISTELMQA